MQLEQLIGKQIQTKLEYVGTMPNYYNKTVEPVSERKVQILRRGKMYRAYDAATWEKIWESEQEIVIRETSNCRCRYLTHIVKPDDGLAHYVRISDGYKFALDTKADIISLDGNLVVFLIEKKRWIRNFITGESMQTARTTGSSYCGYITETSESGQKWLECSISGDKLVQISDANSINYAHDDMLFVTTKLPHVMYATEVYRIIRTEVVVPHCVICGTALDKKIRTHVWSPCGHSNICEMCACANKDVKCPTCPDTVKTNLIKIQ